MPLGLVSSVDSGAVAGFRWRRTGGAGSPSSPAVPTSTRRERDVRADRQTDSRWGARNVQRGGDAAHGTQQCSVSAASAACEHKEWRRTERQLRTLRTSDLDATYARRRRGNRHNAADLARCRRKLGRLVRQALLGRLLALCTAVVGRRGHTHTTARARAREPRDNTAGDNRHAAHGQARAQSNDM
jgi:hypothetical protein